MGEVLKKLAILTGPGMKIYYSVILALAKKKSN